MNHTFEVWGLFDEDDVMQDYSIFEDDIYKWADERFLGKKVSIAKVTIHPRKDITIGCRLNHE